MPKRSTIGTQPKTVRDAAQYTYGGTKAHIRTAWQPDTPAHAPEPAVRTAHGSHCCAQRRTATLYCVTTCCMALQPGVRWLVLRRNTPVGGSGTDLQRVLGDAPLRLRVLARKALVVCAALPKGLALFGRERQLLLDQRHALAETADSAHTDPAVGWA